MLEVNVKTIGDTAFGVVYEEEMIFASNFGSDHKAVLQSFKRMFPTENALRIACKPSEFAEKAVAELRSIYEGNGSNAQILLALERFPAYTQRVLKAVSEIPVGYVASYRGVADAIGGGARAVGNVMATNCFAPLVPCHRVVTSSLGLGGYGGGLRVKYEFLKREKRGFTDPKEVTLGVGVMRVFPAEFVLNKLEKSFSCGCSPLPFKHSSLPQQKL